MGLQTPENKALSQGIIGKSAPILADITIRKSQEIDAESIPDFEILLAGFPCQPFSIAGVSKNVSLGRKHGFDHAKQGNLFFDIARILKEKRPPAFMLENVKNLVSHDKGKTFMVIIGMLKNLGYKVKYKVIDGKSYVPQHRERTYIVGFDRKIGNRSGKDP